MPDVSLSRARELLKYHPTTGTLHWRVSLGSRATAGAEVSTCNSHGYRVVRIDGTLHGQHRVAWLLHYGSPPAGQIDHINGVRNDNRISNLRDVPRRYNQMNMKRRSDNTSGVTGVEWNKQKGRWRARINVKCRVIHLGFFVSKKEAIEARSKAESKYGFHANHGRK